MALPSGNACLFPGNGPPEIAVSSSNVFPYHMVLFSLTPSSPSNILDIASRFLRSVVEAGSCTPSSLSHTHHPWLSLQPQALSRGG